MNFDAENEKLISIQSQFTCLQTTSRCHLQFIKCHLCRVDNRNGPIKKIKSKNNYKNWIYLQDNLINRQTHRDTLTHTHTFNKFTHYQKQLLVLIIYGSFLFVCM